MNAKDETGETPIFYAVRYPEWESDLETGLEMLRVLVNAGADLNITNNRYWGYTYLTPAMLASDLGNIEALKFFIDNEDSFNVKDAIKFALNIKKPYDANIVQFLATKLDNEEEQGTRSANPPVIGLAYSGHVYDWRGCCAECWGNEECTHWTVVREGADGSGCWLKSGSGETNRKTGATSGTRSCLEFV